MIDINFTDQIKAANEKKALNKPFRTPKGPKKFSVYVKNDKGNVVKVNFGDPNMEIKRDDPARRKSFRARHGCDKNPGPKWKAKYWSCRQWRAGAPVEGSVEIDMEAEAKKGLWYNIQKKKERLGQNYKPAKPGDPGYPDKEALKKAQAGEEEWDGYTFWKQEDILKLCPEFAKADDVEIEDDPEEMMYHSQDAAEMALGQFSLCSEKLQQLITKIKDDPMVALEISEPWIISKIAIIEHNVNAIHTYLLYPKEGLASITKNGLERDFEIGSKVKNINPSCKHYGSEGVVKSIKDLPDNMGQVISYEVTNDGENYKKGEIITKTMDQLTKAAVFAPPLILNDHNKKIVDDAYKTIVEPTLEKEHGKRVGAFSEDDVEFQMEYKKSVSIDYPTTSPVTKEDIFTPEELNKQLRPDPIKGIR